MKYAVFSEIHANWEALEAVINYLDKLGVDKFISIGDVIGYGGDPVKCFQWVHENCDLKTIGNHGLALLGAARRVKKAPSVTRHVLPSVFWTLREFDDHQDILDKLEKLPLSKEWNDMYFVHGYPHMTIPEKPHACTTEYFLVPDMEGYPPWNQIRDMHRYVPVNQDDALDAFSMLQQNVCFVGHTHVPCVVEEPSNGGKILFWYFDGVNKRRYELSPDKKVIVNVGAVGQPRDRNPDACFVTIEDGLIEFHRVPYDIEKAQKRIMEGPGIDWHASRLAEGR